jgi:HlyD family secretion protein
MWPISLNTILNSDASSPLLPMKVRFFNPVILAIALIAGTGCGASRAPADAPKAGEESSEGAIKVRAAAVEKRTLSETISGLGKCEALPDRLASAAPAIEGQVARIFVKLGDRVTRGQPIVELDARIAKANLDEKTATREAARASKKLLEAPPRPEELKSQELAVEQAKIAHDKAQAALDRLRPLAERQQISPAQIYEAELAVSQAKLQCDSAEAQLKTMKLGPRSEAIAEAQARVDTSDAGVESAQAQFDLHVLRAPIDGVVESLNCQLGQTVSVGATVADIADISRLQIMLWIAPRDAARIHVDQAAFVAATNSGHSGQAAQGSEDEIAGTVTFVGRIADPQTGNLPVQILIEDPEGRLAVGQLVPARVAVDEKSDVLAAPSGALFDAGEGMVLNVIRDGKARKARPELGIRDRQWVEIKGTDLDPPLAAGEMVIVEGGYNLPDGTEVVAAGQTDDAKEAAQTTESSSADGSTPRGGAL